MKINKAEFERLKNDMHCYKALAYHYAEKAEAALAILQYKYSNDIKDLEKGLLLLEKSVHRYKELVSLTDATYLYANSMQTQQRKIPMRGVNGTYKQWSEMLPVFEKELNTFKHKIDSLKQSASVVMAEVKPFTNAVVRIADNTAISSKITKGGKAFADTNLLINSFAKQLEGLQAVNFNYKQQLTQSTSISFECDKPVKVLVGYFKTQRAAFTKDTIYLKEPELETNASADDYGQAEIKISNAIAIEGLPPVNIHTYSFKAGKNTLKLEKGVCLILGFVDGNTVIPIYDAGLMSDNKNKNLDWLFE